MNHNDIVYYDEDDNDSVHSEDSISYQESEESFHPDPEIIASGDGVEGVFEVIPWKDEYDERVPVTHSYLNVVHSDYFKQWWVQYMTEEVLLKHMGRYEGKRKGNIYNWNYRIEGCNERDPNRWILKTPPSGASFDSSIWENMTQCADVKVEVDFVGNQRGRVMVYLYMKSSGYSNYQHYCGQYLRNLTQEEMTSLQTSPIAEN